MTTNLLPPESSDLIDPALLHDLLCVQSMLADQIDRQQREITALRQQIVAVTGTMSYRFLGRLWPLRRILIPPHSKREQYLKQTVHFIAHTRRRDHDESLHPHPIRHTSVNTTVGLPPEHGERDAPIPPPHVTVLNPNPRLASDLHSWISRQTWPFVDLQPWDEHTLHRENWGRYVCIGSADLLSQPPTWLETNLLVLERENAAFTVNVRGLSIWMTLQLDKGRLPGAEETPLLRMVVRGDCITQNLGIDVHEYMRRVERERPHEFVTLGRIIDWTSRTPDRFSDLPFCGSSLQKTRCSPDTPADADAPYLSPPPHDVVPSTRRTALPGASLIIASKDPLPAAPAAQRPVHRIFEMPRSNDPRPTVLIFQPFLAMGGAERVALDVMKALAERIRFVVVATDSHDAHLGTTVDRFRAITPYVYTAHDFLPAHEQRNFLSYLIARYRPHTFYVANGSAWLLDELPSVQAESPGMRIVNQVYDHRIGWIERYDAHIVRTIDVHIGANERICAAYRRCGASSSSVMQIPHGIDLSEFDPNLYSGEAIQEIRRKLGLPSNAKVVTFIGRLHPQKRPLDFVELARQLQSRRDLTFLMVGDGPYAAIVSEQVRRLRLHNLMRLAFHEPSRDIFAASDVIVLPSQYEGMPLVVLEAQAMGKPVVATDVGNIRHILAATKGGALVTHIGNPDMLRRTVFEALQLRPDVSAMRAILTERYAIELVAEKYAHAFLGESHEDTG